ncbi:MAG: lytic transglycosylase domain-containing protein, partial [Myxococcota bacterium]|nr:lytic transglycosylase domain-containing protein [Myxococcota bacterium]
LAAAGRQVPTLTPAQLVERADRIVRLGPPDLARAEIDQLLEARLPFRERTQVTLLAARIARVEGRFEDEAALIRQARGERDADASAIPAEDPAAAAAARALAEARSELLRLAGSTRTLRRTPSARLFAYLRTAARAGLREELDAALDEVITRSLPCGLRLEAGIVASGTGDDERVARVLEQCTSARGTIGVSSRYHRARALERLGRREEARAELTQVVEQDRSETRWYALWSRQRLGLDRPNVARGATPQVDPATSTADESKGGERERAALPSPLDPSLAAHETPLLPIAITSPELESADDAEDSEDATAAPSPRWTAIPRDEIERRLATMSQTYAEAFPWLGRALALVRLGDDDGATDELHETCLAWHEARGNSPLRAGVESVFRGAAPPRRPTESVAIWRARRTLANDDRLALADIAASLGDHGLAVRFGGRGRAASRPRAYEDIVTEVATERGLDPNLLLAVMRVESVYNPRIVSYAGAVGLLQIMPRTGRLIARSMGREATFGTDDLLDPRTNIEFAAWYLGSLIRRFDGCVPLAVASYNGGPHNVRRWLNEHSGEMPLDAFLERIPFTQTHRYVRRVLMHWAAYRAQQGLPMIELDPTLPSLETDRVAF